MGIKGLGKYIKERVPDALESGKLEDLRGMKIAIDTANFMCSRYKAALSNVAKTSNIDDWAVVEALREGLPLLPALFDMKAAHKYWYELLNLFLKGLISVDAIPVWALEGTSTVHKASERQCRTEGRKRQVSKSEELLVILRSDLYKHLSKYIKGTNTRNTTPVSKPIDKLLHKKIYEVRVAIGYAMMPTSAEIEEMIEYLRNVGQLVAVPNGECEGEALCASLYARDMVDIVFTKDTDALVFGCNRVITDISMVGEGSFVCYNLQTILKGLELHWEPV